MHYDRNSLAVWVGEFSRGKVHRSGVLLFVSPPAYGNLGPLGHRNRPGDSDGNCGMQLGETLGSYSIVKQTHLQKKKKKKLPTPFWGPPPKCDFQHQQYVGYVAGAAIDQQYLLHLDTSLGPNTPGTADRLQLLVVIRNTSIFETTVIDCYF
jgi:hypothetical protein